MSPALLSADELGHASTSLPWDTPCVPVPALLRCLGVLLPFLWLLDGQSLQVCWLQLRCLPTAVGDAALRQDLLWVGAHIWKSF